MVFARFSALTSVFAMGDEGLPVPLPSTFEFIDQDYKGNRFEGQHVAIFGGTSGIGFASAAMFMQECAARTILVGRNGQKGRLAEQVLKQRVSQEHCAQKGVIEYHRADITKRDEIRAVFDSFRSTGPLHAVVQSASVAGYVGNFADLPDEILFTGRDSVYNNVYGTKIVTQEALKFWGQSGCSPLGGQPCPDIGYVPSYIIISSVNGASPTPTAESYGQSKHAMIGLASSIAGSFPAVRVNAILPGLIDTPLTWNQVRSAEIKPDGSIVMDSTMQIGWQCVVDGIFVESGECSDGGTGYSCPCEDIFRDDPRNAAIWGPFWPALDPRRVGEAILDISQGSSNLTGAFRVVDNDNKQYQCFESAGDPGTPPALWQSCPQVQGNLASIV